MSTTSSAARSQSGSSRGHGNTQPARRLRRVDRRLAHLGSLSRRRVSRKTGTRELEAVYEARVVSRPPTEDELVERARGGDAAAFATLVRDHQEIAFRTAYLITRNAADAEDATPDRPHERLARAPALPPRSAPCGPGCSRSSRTRRATGDARRGVVKGWRCARRTSFPRGARLRLPREGWSPPRPAPSCSPRSSG